MTRNDVGSSRNRWYRTALISGPAGARRRRTRLQVPVLLCHVGGDRKIASDDFQSSLPDNPLRVTSRRVHRPCVLRSLTHINAGRWARSRQTDRFPRSGGSARCARCSQPHRNGVEVQPLDKSDSGHGDRGKDRRRIRPRHLRCCRRGWARPAAR